MFHARDRSFGKHTVLILANTAAEATELAMAEASNGHLVKVLPMDFNGTHSCVTEMQQAGIEVLYGDIYRSTWQNWLGENKHFFDCVYYTDAALSLQHPIDLTH